MIKHSTYLEYQEALHGNKLFRAFWEFWGNHSFVFFVAAGIYALANPEYAVAARQLSILLIAALLIARGIVVTIINAIYERQRPYQVYGFVPITSRFFSFTTRIPNSFPSRHATVFFAWSTVVSLFFPGLGAALVAVSLATGVARVVLGYHWSSDVIAGALIGTLVGYLTVLIGHPLLFT